MPSQEDLEAQIDRLTTANLELAKEAKRAKKNLYDYFLGQALSGSAAFDSWEAEAIVKKAIRIAEAAMRLR